MSARHVGITCDACSQQEFRLRRYKCLICGDYDLCGACYDRQRETNDHIHSHPMQCLIPKGDHGLFYSGEPPSNSNAKSFTCPLCGQLGFTEASLSKHIFHNHASQDTPDTEVICPLCVSQPDGDPNRKTRQLARHLTAVHHLSTSASDVRQNDVSPIDSLVGLPTTISSTTPASGRRLVTLLPSTRRSVEPRSSNRSRTYTTLPNSTSSFSSAAHAPQQRQNTYRAVIDMLHDTRPPSRAVSNWRTPNRLDFISRANVEMDIHNQCNNAGESVGSIDAKLLFPPVPASSTSSTSRQPPTVGGQTSRSTVSSAGTAQHDYDDDDDDEEDDDESDEPYNEGKEDSGREEKTDRTLVDQPISVPSVGTADDATVTGHPVSGTDDTSLSNVKASGIDSFSLRDPAPDGTTISDSSKKLPKSQTGVAACMAGVTEATNASPPTTDKLTTAATSYDEFDSACSHFLGELVWSSLWLTEDAGDK